MILGGERTSRNSPVTQIAQIVVFLPFIGLFVTREESVCWSVPRWVHTGTKAIWVTAVVHRLSKIFIISAVICATEPELCEIWIPVGCLQKGLELLRRLDRNGRGESLWSVGLALGLGATLSGVTRGSGVISVNNQPALVIGCFFPAFLSCWALCFGGKCTRRKIWGWCYVARRMRVGSAFGASSMVAVVGNFSHRLA